MRNTMPLEITPLRPDELGRLHVLRRVALESVWGLLQECRLCALAPGEQLLHKGQSNQTMYMILDGKLAVHLDSVDTAPVAHLQAGETVGEISVIDDSPVTANVIASLPTRLLAVEEECFWRMIQVSHSFATNMLLLLAQRMRANNFKMTENMRLREKLEREAMIDGLTKIFNRRWLDERLPRLIHRFRFDGRPLSLLMADVDHFKRFNDTHGHVAGDQVLATVARTLAAHIRPTDFVVRYGGEEFALILPGTGQSGALVAAERLRKVVRLAAVELDARSLPPVTISLGAATLREGENASDLLVRADQALYRAKEGGRDRVEGEA
jgi:diguanylate cyclase (GGDEF)-like protein